MYCDVVVDIVNKQVNKTFLYHIPDCFLGVITIGHRVKVQFGKRIVLGYVMNILDTCNYDTSKVLDIIDIVDIKPILNEEFISLCKYMVKNYYTFYVTALQTMIPSVLKAQYSKYIKIVNKDKLSLDLLDFVKDNDYILINDSLNPYLKEIKKLSLTNDIIIESSITNKVKNKSIKYISLLDDSIKIRSKKGLEFVNYLKEVNKELLYDEVINDMGYSKGVIKTLSDNGVINITKREIYRSIDDFHLLDDKVVTLNDLQKEIYEDIKSNLYKNNKYLLHGVTGSGKTEIYLNLISDVINDGYEAILLVPEISLTPQMTRRFKARFKDSVAVIHSGLSSNERYDQWRKILNKEAKIVVGARSAIFAPFTNLGLIIIDEEHESSYKQDVNPKYSAKDIALFRTKYHNATLLLGSATPSIDSYYKAINKEYTLKTLDMRANQKPQPNTYLVDMTNEIKTNNRSIFSRQLLALIKEKFLNGEQIILFLNRRGHSSFVMCRECGHVVKCPNCDVSLTYHHTTNKLMCHHCGYTQPSPTSCPNCNSSLIRFVGGGTQKVCEELSKLIPEIKIIRVDTDTTRQKDSFDKLFESFKNKEADVIVGTQIITKGLDFSNVTLVGVLNADLSLKFPVYDAFEITYNLIEQVSGRSGRADKQGDVVIQTYDTTNYAVVCAKNHNYKKYYDFEIKNRQLLNNPPFVKRVNILVSASTYNKAQEESNTITKIIKTMSKDIIIYGPCQASILKMNNMYRFTITLKFNNNDNLESLSYINEIYQNNKDILVSISTQ